MSWPGLGNDRLYEGRDLALTTDFRDVFAEVAQNTSRSTKPSEGLSGTPRARRSFAAFFNEDRLRSKKRNEEGLDALLIFRFTSQSPNG